MLAFAALLMLPVAMGGDSGDSELISKGIQKVMECAGEGNVQMDVCMEMFKPNAKLDDEKYQPCKCWVPCVAKKMDMMSAEGTFKEGPILTTLNGLKTPGYKEEGLRVYDKCKNVEGTNCVAGFNMVSCVMKESEKARELVAMLMDKIGGKST